MSATQRMVVPRAPVREPARPRFGRVAKLVRRALHTAALAACVAVIAHVVIVLLIPRLAPVDAWAKLSAVTRPWTFSEIARPAGAGGSPESTAAIALPDLDPFFGTVACRFDLRQGPASVVAEGAVPFWSLAVFDRRGQNIYSLNDRTAIDRRLDLVIVDPTQRARLRENPIEGMERSILVRANITEGFVLLRALAPDETWVPTVRRFLRGATCERLAIPAAQPA